MDENGILQVAATDKATQTTEKITIVNDRGALSQEEIQRMVEEARQWEEHDQQLRERVAARNELEGLVYNLRNQVDDDDIVALLGPPLLVTPYGQIPAPRASRVRCSPGVVVLCVTFAVVLRRYQGRKKIALRGGGGDTEAHFSNPPPPWPP